MSKIVHRGNCKCQENPEAWRVNSEEHFNCFFTYMRHNNRSHTLNEISKLLSMTITAVTVTEKKAITKLSKSEKAKKLKLSMLD